MLQVIVVSQNNTLNFKNLYDKYSEKGLVVLGVPSNQFGGQEPGSNNEIKDFCETNFNITFPMTTKIDVKGENAHPIYLWAKENHGNAAVPKWNFHKILINKQGKIEDTYSSFTKPMSKKLINKIEEIL
jgi:glutathione peroxidase